MDELHLFDDIRISKYSKSGRLLTAVSDFIKAVSANILLFCFFVGAIISLAIFTDALISDLSTYETSLFISLFGSCTVLVTGSYLIAKALSLRYRHRCNVGFKDSWFLLSGLNACAIYFLPFIKAEPLSGIIAVVLLVIGLTIGITIFYFIKAVKKKQPDLDIPMDIEAEAPVDHVFKGDVKRKKIQLRGDSRDAVLISCGCDVNLVVKGKTKRIKFSVGLRESSANSLKNGVLFELFDLSDISGRKRVYSKFINPVSDYLSRGWIDVDLEFDDGGSEENRELVLVATSDKMSGSREEKLLCFSGPRVSGKAKPRKIIYIVMDAVRSDHLGCYGYGRNITSNIDALAGAAIRYENAFVQGEWTLPSFMSMLTGMYPSSHGVYNPRIYSKLGKDVKTLPEVLRNNGFITRGNFTHKRLMSTFGFAKGFDSHWYQQCDKEWNVATSDDMTDRALDIMDYHNDDDLFLMLHYFDTHQPCVPATPYSEKFDKLYDRKIKKDIRMRLIDGKIKNFDDKDLNNLIARYDSEILRLDTKIGVIIDCLKRSGHYDDAMIIITADHGMPLNDHGNMTKLDLFDELMKVPLIIKYPRSVSMGKSAVVKDFVESGVDIMPTILETYDCDVPDTVQGISVKPDINGSSTVKEKRSCAVSELIFKGTYSVSVRDDEFRYNFVTSFVAMDFGEFRLEDAENKLYKVDLSGVEKEISMAGNEKLVEEYKKRVNDHMKKIIKGAELK